MHVFDLPGTQLEEATKMIIGKNSINKIQKSFMLFIAIEESD